MRKKSNLWRESVALREVSWKGLETLAIACFDPFKGYTEYMNRAVNRLV